MGASRLRYFRAQYRLATLLILVTTICAGLGVREATKAWHERQYQKRFAAAELLHASYNVTLCVQVGPDPCRDTWALGSFPDRDDITLRRDDVVTEVLCDTAISDDEVSAILCFPTLRVLNLDGSQITDVQLGRLAALPFVEEVNLNYSQISDYGVRHLRAFRLLRDLRLWETKVTGAGFEGFSSLRKLEKLKLSSTHVDDDGVRHLAGLPSLSELDLYRTRITDAASAHLSTLAALRSLNLAGTTVGDETFQRLASLPSLTTLRMDETRVTDAGLEALTSSERRSALVVYLNGCPSITDRGVLGLASVKFPLSISLHGSSITAASVAKAQRLNPKLNILWDDTSEKPPANAAAK